jgi:hypothetical protein
VATSQPFANSLKKASSVHPKTEMEPRISVVKIPMNHPATSEFGLDEDLVTSPETGKSPCIERLAFFAGFLYIFESAEVKPAKAACMNP